MQQPFPELTDLDLAARDERAPVVPASFLGGSAPQLRFLTLHSIPFPGLPKILLSATHLVNVTLRQIPHSGYFSPEALVTCLSVLTRLERLVIGLKSPQSRPDRTSRHPPPQTRALLPILTILRFGGASEYLEDLVARIDAPLLDNLKITFFHQLIFDTPYLAQFVSRTPKFNSHDEARVVFNYLDVSVTTCDGRLRLENSCRQSDWQLSSLAQICSSAFPHALISTVDHLYIDDGFHRPRELEDIEERFHGQEDIESSQWLELLHPFISVKHLYISPKSMPSIAFALQELIGKRVTDVLPALETLFLEKLPSKPVQETIEKFVATREFVSYPIAVSRWDKTTSKHF